MLADAVTYFLDFPFFFAPPAFLAAGFLGEDFLATGFFFGEDFLAVTGGFLATFDFLAGTALLGDGAPRFPFLGTYSGSASSSLSSSADSSSADSSSDSLSEFSTYFDF